MQVNSFTQVNRLLITAYNRKYDNPQNIHINKPVKLQYRNTFFICKPTNSRYFNGFRLQNGCFFGEDNRGYFVSFGQINKGYLRVFRIDYKRQNSNHWIPHYESIEAKGSTAYHIKRYLTFHPKHEIEYKKDSRESISRTFQQHVPRY